MKGEYWLGAGKGKTSMGLITLGTGVGSGLIINDKIWRGSNFSGGEIGHFILYPGGRTCKCGLLGWTLSNLQFI